MYEFSSATQEKKLAPHKVSRRSFEVKPNYPHMLNFSSGTESKYIMHSCYTEIVNGKSTQMHMVHGCSQGKCRTVVGPAPWCKSKGNLV